MWTSKPTLAGPPLVSSAPGARARMLAANAPRSGQLAGASYSREKPTTGLAQAGNAANKPAPRISGMASFIPPAAGTARYYRSFPGDLLQFRHREVRPVPIATKAFRVVVTRNTPGR